MKSNEAAQKILILHDIRSSQNVGSVFRTADAAGITQIILSGITPAPVDRFGRVNTQLTKASLGAESYVPWKQVTRLGTYLQTIQKHNVTVIAIEQDTHSVDYTKVKVSGDVAFILGNEVDGLPQAILRRADIIAHIPMKGKKESLNVSVAAGIALFRILGV